MNSWRKNEIERSERRILDLEDAVEYARLELRSAEANLAAENERLARLHKDVEEFNAAVAKASESTDD